MRIESTGWLSRLLRGGPFRRKDCQGDCYVIETTHKHINVPLQIVISVMMMYQFELQDTDGNMEYKRLIGR